MSAVLTYDRKVFPFTLYANRLNGHTRAPSLRETFLSHKPASTKAYAFDAIVNSRTQVLFIAYDMASMLEGGVGVELCRFMVTDVDPEATRQLILDRVADVAGEVRQEQLANIEHLATISIMNQIMAEEGLL